MECCHDNDITRIATVMAPTVTLFGHSYCSLCFDMQKELEALTESMGFRVEFVDIEGRPELERRFGELVPALFLGEVEICHYYLDKVRLRAFLKRAAQDAGC